MYTSPKSICTDVEKIILKHLKKTLTPKGPLSIRGTNGISGRYLQAEFLLRFFEKKFEERKIDKLSGNIIYFSIGAQEQKLCPNKLKTGERGQQKFEFFFGIFFP